MMDEHFQELRRATAVQINTSFNVVRREYKRTQISTHTVRADVDVEEDGNITSDDTAGTAHPHRSNK